MFLLIDYGLATAKTFLVDSSGHYLLNEIPLGFSAFTKISIQDSFLYILARVQELTGVSLLKDQKPICPVYAVGEVASIKLKEIVSGEIENPTTLLKESDLPIIAVNKEAALVGQDIFRGEIEPGAVALWLPFQINESEIANYQANARYYSQTVPYTPRDLELEYAVARAKIEKALEGKLISVGEVYITGGILTHSPKPQLTFLTILNGITFDTPLKIIMDKEQVLLSFSLMKKYSPSDYNLLWEKEKGSLSVLGTAIRVAGNTLVDILVEGQSESQQISPAPESLMMFPLGSGQKARIKLGKGKEFIVEGGTVGLVFDARARPIKLPVNGKERRDNIRNWNIACSAHGEVPEIWI
ncbi:MAG: hypothetical protein AAB486_01305 [Patescibacteria group bacterium]